jgi:hypothetical protein
MRKKGFGKGIFQIVGRHTAFVLKHCRTACSWHNSILCGARIQSRYLPRTGWESKEVRVCSVGGSPSKNFCIRSLPTVPFPFHTRTPVSK